MKKFFVALFPRMPSEVGIPRSWGGASDKARGPDNYHGSRVCVYQLSRRTFSAFCSVSPGFVFVFPSPRRGIWTRFYVVLPNLDLFG